MKSKIEILSKRSISKVAADNIKIENFYKKIENQKTAIRAKIEKLEKQVREEEAKLYHKEQEGLNYKKYPTQLVGKELDEEKEFFENVTHHAYAFDSDNIKSEEVYMDGRDGKWYSVGIRIPATFDENGQCNGMDESKTYFKKEEIEV
jgi:hypothetical protein